MISFDDQQFEKLKLTIPLKIADYLLGYERVISLLRYYPSEGTEAVSQYHCSHSELMNKHAELVRRLGLEESYAKLKAPKYESTTLARYLSTLPTVLIEIIVGYCTLTQDSSEDLDEIYDRLLKLDDFQIL